MRFKMVDTNKFNVPYIPTYGIILLLIIYMAMKTPLKTVTLIVRGVTVIIM